MSSIFTASKFGLALKYSRRRSSFAPRAALLQGKQGGVSVGREPSPCYAVATIEQLSHDVRAKESGGTSDLWAMLNKLAAICRSVEYALRPRRAGR